MDRPPLEIDVTLVPAPDRAATPAAFVVVIDAVDRIAFHDWGGPPTEDRPVLLIHGLSATAWSWAPVARRLASVRHVVAMDLRGHGISDAPTHGYDPDTLTEDAVAVADGAGLLAAGPLVVAGHGFGAIVAAWTAAVLGPSCAGLVLVDGGWESLEAASAMDVEEFLRGLDEPPEVLRSMDAYLADRRGYDPGTWDADQERAARDGVVETAAGHVVRAVRPFVVEAIVRTMFAYDPGAVVPSLAAPVAALVALGAGHADARLAELRRTAAARVAAGRDPVRVAGFPADAHNLMRYRPAEVTAAILEVGEAPEAPR